MSMDRAQHGGTHLSDPLPAADEPAPGIPEPVTKHAGRFLPSSRYRHPGDVIRLIGSGLVLTGMIAAVAVAPGQLTGAGAATVTWLGSDPAGRLLTGLVQVAFVGAGAAAVAASLWHRRFRLLAGLVAGAVVAGAALAGILYLAGNKYPPAVTAVGEHGSWLASAAFPWPPLLAAAVAVTVAAAPSLAQDGMDRAGCRGRGPADYRCYTAGRTGSRVRFRGDRRCGRARRIRRARPADRIRGDRGRAAVRRAARRLRRAGWRPDQGLPAIRGRHR